ncbi:MAG: TSUP family transporter [Lentisphaeria bacterium]
MDILQIIWIGVVVFLAGMLQSAIGFGFALFATPLLILLGLPLPSVIVLVSTCSMTQSTLGAVKLRHEVPWRLSLLATVVRCLSVVAGLFLLKKLLGFSTVQIRMAIGSILCLLVILQIFYHPIPRPRIHWIWGGLAFIGSGLLSGICGMGGPPLVLWVMAHDWNNQKSRAFLFATFAAAVPVQIALMGLNFGRSILGSIALGLLMLPLIYLGSSIGLPIGNRMSKERLRKVAYAVLLIIGISAIVPAFLQR